MKKIEKALEKKSDERADFENGKIYKNILEKIVIATNIIFFLNTRNIELEIVMLIINLSVFIGVGKTLKIGTFEGSLNKFVYYFSTLYVVNIFYIIWWVLDLIFKSSYLVGDFMFMISPLVIIIEIIQAIYIIKKGKLR